MSIILPYNKASVHEVGGRMDVPVPANIISLVKGESARNNLRRGIACLATDPTVNTAIITDKHAGGMNIIPGIGIVAPYSELKISFSNMNSEGAVIERLRQYFMSRAQAQLKTAAPAAFSREKISELEGLGAYIFADSRKVTSSDRVEIVAARFSYVGTYKSLGKNGEARFAPHVDARTAKNFDIRVAHSIEGCATTGFADDDFITYFNPYRKLIDVKFARPFKMMDGWAGPQGTYTILRGSSERALADGAKPGVHAHGQARSEDCRRTSISYDLVFMS